MERVIDARGLRCPLPYAKARAALRRMDPDDPLVVLATDPEAPVDLGALAADTGRPFACVPQDGGWRLELGGVSSAGPSSPAP